VLQINLRLIHNENGYFRFQFPLSLTNTTLLVAVVIVIISWWWNDVIRHSSATAPTIFIHAGEGGGRHAQKKWGHLISPSPLLPFYIPSCLLPMPHSHHQTQTVLFYFTTFLFPLNTHRLNSSSCPALTVTSEPYRNGQNSTPHWSKPPNRLRWTSA